MSADDPQLEPASTGDDPVPIAAAEPVEAEPPAQDSAASPPADSPTSPVAPPPTIADGLLHALDRRALALAWIGSAIKTVLVAGLLFVALAIVRAQAPLPPLKTSEVLLLWGGVSLILAGWFFRWPVVQHRHFAYVIDAQGIEIRRGVLWRRVIHVPRSRVQHTDVSQGPLERSFGLGTLVLYTAGTQFAKVELGGLAHATAVAIRDYFVFVAGDVAGDGGDAV